MTLLSLIKKIFLPKKIIFKEEPVKELSKEPSKKVEVTCLPGTVLPLHLFLSPNLDNHYRNYLRIAELQRNIFATHIPPSQELH